MSQDPRVKNEHGRLQPTLVRDRRRTDPVALQPQRPAERASLPPSGAEGRLSAADSGQAQDGAQLHKAIAELTADLQRLKAEYDNYRKRVHRDRLAIREIAVANVLAGLLPVLDAIEQARKQTDEAGMKAVADVLECRLAELGLQTVGAPGAPFDPSTHEALTYHVSGQAAQAVCTAVLRRGYRVGTQLLRPAQVSVTGPPAGAPIRIAGEDSAKDAAGAGDPSDRRDASPAR